MSRGNRWLVVWALLAAATVGAVFLVGAIVNQDPATAPSGSSADATGSSISLGSGLNLGPADSSNPGSKSASNQLASGSDGSAPALTAPGPNSVGIGGGGAAPQPTGENAFNQLAP